MWSFAFVGRLNRNVSGAALVEVSAVIPLVLLIGLGVVEFGNAIYSEHLIENGVRDAARYVARMPRTDSATNTANNTKAAYIAVYGTATAPSDTCNSTSTLAMKNSRRVSWWCDTSTISVTYPCFNNVQVVAGCALNATPGTKIYRGLGSITTVTVTATVPYASLGFMSYFNLAAPTFSLSHTERIVSER